MVLRATVELITDAVMFCPTSMPPPKAFAKPR
jgi:hypothetical protein